MLLKCPECNSNLKISHGYTGADWNSEAGARSHFDYEIALDCMNIRCAHRFIVGYVKSPHDFSEPIAELKPYLTGGTE